MFGLFGRKYAYCSMRLKGSNYIERMGKNFCSEEHANTYWEYNRNAGKNVEGNDDEDSCDC